jgi:hypothetical protein
METASKSNPPAWMYWLGWVLTVLPSTLLVMGGVMMVTNSPQAVEGLAKAGWDPAVMRPLGIVVLLSVTLYLNPKTSILGAILLTGYMGGAIAHHLSQKEDVYIQPIFGAILWLGIYLREPRLWSLMPWRS